MPMVSPQLLPSTRLGTGMGLWDPFVNRAGRDDSIPGAPGDQMYSGAGSFPATFSPPDSAPATGSVSSSGTNATSPVSTARQTDDDDLVLPLGKSRTSSLGSLASSFRPFSGDAPPSRGSASLYIQNLPRNMTRREIHLMFTFATDFVSCELHSHGTSDDGLPASVAATARFRSLAGATTALTVLEHRPDIFGDLLYSHTATPHWPLKCEIRSGGVPLPNNSASASTNNLASTSGPSTRNSKSRFLFMSGEDQQPVSGPVNTPATTAPCGPSSNADLHGHQSQHGAHGNATSSADRMFSPSSPRNVFQHGRSIFTDNEFLPPLTGSLGNLHLSAADRRPSTGNLFEEKQKMGTNPRRASVPRQLSQLSVDGVDGSRVVVPYTPGASAKAMSIMQNGGRVMPPANPADQNPPCNTLYVGNLPPDTSEDELKDLFSVRPGYKRLCFRTKANGPMCFVEFEDENYAGRALEELYGFGLSNSVKGGIRLSFSKNPLGVRSNRSKHNHP